MSRAAAGLLYSAGSWCSRAAGGITQILLRGRTVRKSKFMTKGREPFVVKTDPLLLPLIPKYLDNRRQDLARLTDAVAQRDLKALRKLGHDMSGSGGAYGLPPVSELGKRIEEAALAGDTAVIAAATEELRAFLDTVELPA